MTYESIKSIQIESNRCFVLSQFVCSSIRSFIRLFVRLFWFSVICAVAGGRTYIRRIAFISASFPTYLYVWVGWVGGICGQVQATVIFTISFFFKSFIVLLCGSIALRCHQSVSFAKNCYILILIVMSSSSLLMLLGGRCAALVPVCPTEYCPFSSVNWEIIMFRYVISLFLQKWKHQKWMHECWMLYHYGGNGRSLLWLQISFFLARIFSSNLLFYYGMSEREF